jgi:histidinol-phosphate aminotransferase
MTRGWSVANFILVHFPITADRNAADADAFLCARGLILRRLEAFRLPNALWLSVGTEVANRPVIAALSAFMDRAPWPCAQFKRRSSSAIAHLPRRRP